MQNGKHSYSDTSPPGLGGGALSPLTLGLVSCLLVAALLFQKKVSERASVK